MNEFTSTKRIHLRKFRKEQVELLYQLNGDPEVMNLLSILKTFPITIPDIPSS